MKIRCLFQQGHSAEIISLSFNQTGTHLITGSFDNTVMVWDVKTGKRVYTLVGHQAEVSSAQFNFDCSLIATGSMDKTCKLWDFERGEIIKHDFVWLAVFKQAHCMWLHSASWSLNICLDLFYVLV